MTETSICTGIFISANWVLTAAHCIPGNNYIKDITTEGEVTYSVTDIYSHEKYDSESYKNDIAVIRVTSQVHKILYVTSHH